MKIICSIAIALSTLCVASEEPPVAVQKEPAEVQNEYGYISLGLGPAPIPLPQFGAGYRNQLGHHGVDGNVVISTVIELTLVKFNLNYLYYLEPSVKSQFYVGGGPAIGVLLSDRGFNRDGAFGGGPQFVFGKQYLTDSGSNRHFQADVIWPTVLELCGEGVCFYPLVSFTYAWGF